MKLGLIFTLGTSVAQWHKLGLLDREKLLYEKFIKEDFFQEIYWFTYGKDDKKYQSYLNNKIKIIPLPKIFHFKIGVLFYSFFMPIIQKKYFKDVAFIKTNQMLGAWTALMGCKLYKKKLITRSGYTWNFFEQNKHKKRIAEFTEKLLFKNARAIIFSSQYDAKYFLKKYNLNADKISVIHNYVDTNLFKPLPAIKKNNKKIIYFGRLTEQKNLQNLVKALADTPYELDIYGNGPLKKDLRELTTLLKAKVNFLDNIANSELPRIINKYSLFVLPSLFEGLPKALLEAMSCSIACVATNVRGINEIIKHGENGWLIDVSATGIKKGIIKVITNEKLQKKLGDNARQTVINNFSLEKIYAKEKRLYENLL